MLTVILTVLPIFSLIVIGSFLRRTKQFPADAWPPVERLTYYVLFPALLFTSLAKADLSGLPIELMAAGVVGTPALMALALFGVRRKLNLDGAGFTSLVQGAIRFNTFLGIPLVLAFQDQAGLALSALFIAFMIPFINVLCVWVLARYGHGTIGAGAILREMCRNPLIIGCAAGIAVNLLGGGLPEPVLILSDLLGQAAPPIGLLCVGAGLDITAVKAGRSWVALSCVLKLAVMPVIALAIATVLGLTGGALWVLVVFHALPTAPSAYIMARQLGGDARLMAGILTVQTALSSLTLPVWISIMAA